jgi:N-acetylneuraminic acid mutarotase
VFLAGGLTNDTFFSDVDIYDSQTDTWAKENLSTPRSNCAAVAAMDKVFFAGGFLGINRYSDKIDIYNTLSGTWSSTVLSEPRSGILALHEADKIYFIGGENAGGISCTVDVYDVYTGSMTNFILPFCRKGFSGLVHKNKLYIAGGMSTTDNENFSVQISVQIMDILTKSWSYGCLSEAKFWSKNLPAHVVGDKIFFLGSWADNYNWNTLNSLESYDPINNKWAFVPETNQDTYTPAGVVKNQKIFLLKNQLRLVQNRLVKTNILFETEF